MPNLKLTPISEWGNVGELVELPSGRVAKLKRLNVLMMARGGKDVPNFLKTYIAGSIQGTSNGKSPFDDLADPSEAIDMMLFIAKEVFVYPVLVEGQPEKEDEVALDCVATEDISFAAAFGLGDPEAVAQLKDFRVEPEGDVEPVPAGAGVGKKSRSTVQD